ncbi:MAG: N-acetylneuraminate synthase family protein [Lachnospiraceae bacterium]|nr:N-acetylneuraminate synthase family protein [Lachnospiraceae bacterium]
MIRYFEELEEQGYYLIAEIGVNYYDIADKKGISLLEAAKLMVKEAKQCGINAVKFQSYKAEKLASKHSPAYWDLNEESTQSQYELFKKYDIFGESEYGILKEYCDNLDIAFMSTPFDFEAVDYLLYADAVINALYEKQENPNTYCGEKYYCVRDEFILFNDKRFSENVKNVLIVFGGTDPENLTMKVINAIEKTGHKEIQYTCILGLGYGDESPILEKVKDMDYSVKILRNVNNIAEYMYQADIAISSQGRTMYELACMKVPTIIIAQNEREQTHYFGDIANGFINLGLGTEIDEPTITETLKWLIKSEVIRKNLYRRMKDKDFTMGIKRVKRIVLGD